MNGLLMLGLIFASIIIISTFFGWVIYKKFPNEY